MNTNKTDILAVASLAKLDIEDSELETMSDVLCQFVSLADELLDGDESDIFTDTANAEPAVLRKDIEGDATGGIDALIDSGRIKNGYVAVPLTVEEE